MSDQSQWGVPDPNQATPPPGGQQPPPGGGFVPPPQQPPPGSYTPPPQQAPPQGYVPPQQAPPQGYAPPGAMGGPAPKKKSNLWKWILGILLLMVLGVGGCSFVVFNAIKGPIDRSNEFLAAVENEDWNAAAELSSDSSACFGPGVDSTLEGFFGSGQLISYNLNSSNVSSTNGESEAQVGGTLEAQDGQYSIDFVLVKENGSDWLVCGINTEFLE